MSDFFEVIEAQEVAIAHALAVLKGTDDKAIDEYCGLEQDENDELFSNNLI